MLVAEPCAACFENMVAVVIVAPFFEVVIPGSAADMGSSLKDRKFDAKLCQTVSSGHASLPSADDDDVAVGWR